MGRSTADGFQKATADYDEPPYCASPNPQEAIIALPSHQPICHRSIDCPEDGGGIEQPVYYISRALKDTKTRYPRVERACLAIVCALRRLRHYFLAYEV